MAGPLGVAIVALIGATSGALGAGVGAAIRSQLVAILGVLTWSLLVEPLLGGLVSVTRKWLPLDGAQASLAQLRPGLLRPGAGALLLAGYLVIATGMGVAVTLRRDVT